MTVSESVVSMPEIIRRPPPLGLYVHLPWCVRKCPYCDFNSHKSPSTIPEGDYIAALLADAESLPPLLWGRRVQTIFIGGGTPSLFTPAAIDKLLCGLRALFVISPDAEITLEANPGSSEASKFADFAAAGINRLSLGVQSFNDDALTALGRVHDGAASHNAAAAAAKHFPNFNIDLMHALPAQNAEAACADVAAALQYKPPHLSLYQLTLEVGTPFYRQPPAQLPCIDSVADIGDAVVATAAAAGFTRYEISAYAKDEKYCR
ncbi:MAG: radical SAM family heme chaperone HemW, partial [Gammaproteobacteria bacterium WSBS_2016_MAG_OTU1]